MDRHSLPRWVRSVCLGSLLGLLVPGYGQDAAATPGSLDSLLALRSQAVERFLAEADSLRLADSLLRRSTEALLDNQALVSPRQRRLLRQRIDSLEQAQPQREQRLQARADSLRSGIPGVPVVILQDTVFYLYAGQGPNAPSDRAADLSALVEQLAENNQFRADQMTVFTGPDLVYVMHGSKVVMRVSRFDAFWMGRDPVEAGTYFSERIAGAVAAYDERNRFLYTLFRVGLLIVLLLIIYFGVRFMNRWLNRLNEKLVRLGRLRFGKSLRFKHYELLTVDRAENIAKRVLTGLKWIIIAVAVYLALPVMFSIFPATEAIAQTLLDLVLSPVRIFLTTIIGFIPELITIAVIMVITHYIIVLLRFLAREVAQDRLHLPGFYPEWASPTFNLLRIIIYAFAFVVIFPYLPGSDSPVFRGVSVFFGLLISLGSSSAISNIIAGLVIIYMRAFKVGDRVKIGETTGEVVEKTMLITRVRTIKNENVTIPNASILSGSTINYSATAKDIGLILSSSVTIGYDVPWRKAHELLVGAARKTTDVLATPPPFVLQTSLDDFFVSYQINAYTDKPEFTARIYSDLHGHIQDAFNEAGVEILSPHYRAARDGSMSTIPPQYLPPDYRPPSLRVQVSNEPTDAAPPPDEPGPPKKKKGPKKEEGPEQ